MLFVLPASLEKGQPDFTACSNTVVVVHLENETKLPRPHIRLLCVVPLCSVRTHVFRVEQRFVV